MSKAKDRQWQAARDACDQEAKRYFGITVTALIKHVCKLESKLAEFKEDEPATIVWIGQGSPPDSLVKESHTHEKQ
jgi:hypothetical protein